MTVVRKRESTILVFLFLGLLTGGGCHRAVQTSSLPPSTLRPANTSDGTFHPVADRIIAHLKYRAPSPSPEVVEPFERLCTQCHAGINPVRGVYSLNHIGLEHNAAWIVDKVRHPHRYLPPSGRSGMPSFSEQKLPSRQLRLIAAYLARLKNPKLPDTRLERQDVLNDRLLMRRAWSASSPFMHDVRDGIQGPERFEMKHYDGSRPPTERLIAALVDQCNYQISMRMDLYKDRLYTQASLSAETRAMVENRKRFGGLWWDPTAMQWMDRYMLTDLYPDLFAAPKLYGN